jgi:hypothetical protein
MTAAMAAPNAGRRLTLYAATITPARPRRVVEAHVRFHARYPLEALVKNRELKNLDVGN